MVNSQIVTSAGWLSEVGPPLHVGAHGVADLNVASRRTGYADEFFQQLFTEEFIYWLSNYKVR